MGASAGVSADDIDGLLERYLGLLDEYTKLRATLTKLQTSVYQNIARANFSAERGIRYGQEMYDERMQASRSLVIALREDNVPKFEITSTEIQKRDAAADEQGREGDTKKTESEKDDEEAEVGKQKPRDALRWFGILTPMPLRQAQTMSIQAVEQIIPKLITTSAEMADLEIRVRRARKKRAKAEATAVKKHTLHDEKPAIEEEAAVMFHKDADVVTEKLGFLSTGGEDRSEGITA